MRVQFNKHFNETISKKHIFFASFPVCQAGYYVMATGGSGATCEACPAGTYSENGTATDMDSCTDCPRGTFRVSGTLGAGPESCTDCTTGTWTSDTGAALPGDCNGESSDRLL